MARFNKKNLLSELEDRTELTRTSSSVFSRLENNMLIKPHGPGQWSIAQIFEHLNISHAIYIQSILKKITHGPEVISEDYNSGWLGDWLYQKMLPREDGTLVKLKTPPAFRPPFFIADGRDVMDRFNQQLDTLHDIFTNAATKDIERNRVPLTTAKLLSVRVGDALRYMVAHNERHLSQAQQLKRRMEESAGLFNNDRAAVK